MNRENSHPVGHGVLAMSTERVDCAVIIVTFNSDIYIARLLDGLADAAPGLSLRVIVVDNGSTDATMDLVVERSDVICIRASRNCGYAAAINIGRTYAGDCSALLVLNPDVLLEAGSVTRMFDALQDSKIGIAVPMLIDPAGHTLPSLRREPTIMRSIGDCFFGQRFRGRPRWSSATVWDPGAYEYRHAIDWATGAVMMIASECDHKVGPWDEQFFLYSEETDYAVRGRSNGFRIEYLPTARAQHTGGGSGTSDELAALLAVNRVRYAEKWSRWPRVFRGTVLLHELLRSYSRGHRMALRILLQRSRWIDLTQKLQECAADASREQLDEGSKLDRDPLNLSGAPDLHETDTSLRTHRIT
jgi:GT2 family glycosyltransferase